MAPGIIPMGAFRTGEAHALQRAGFTGFLFFKKRQ